ncbi:MAG: DUF6089 family protein [Chitinophagaceae bacterium]|nr:DUF6089 family protein [Chitinophagaceae bacterium]
MQMKCLSSLAIFLIIAPVAIAQRGHIGIFGGAAAYSGDLSNKPFPRKVTNGAIGLTYSYEISDLIMLRTGFTYSIVGGADRYNEKPTLSLRNLSFETQIFELSIVGEYHLLNLNYNRYSPYFFAGFAVYKFNPYAYAATGEKAYLQPLSTEGQGLAAYPDRKPYKLTQFAMPFGGGVKFRLTKKLRVGGELGIRKLFTDYFDDLSTNYIDQADLMAAKGQLAVDMAYRGDEVEGGSQLYPTKSDKRGNPKRDDYYYFAGVHVTYLLAPGRKNQTGCPVNVY